MTILPLKEAARRAEVSLRAMQQWCRRGWIACRRKGPKLWLVEWPIKWSAKGTRELRETRDVRASCETREAREAIGFRARCHARV